MKNILIIAVALFMLEASMAVRAESEDATSFVGLWEAVSSDDGSHLILSIADKGEGTFKLLFYATYFTTCNGGRGIIQGTGKVSAEGALTSDDFILTCFETGNTVNFPATLTRNSDGTLTGGFSGSAPPTIFHKTSQ